MALSNRHVVCRRIIIRLAELSPFFAEPHIIPDSILRIGRSYRPADATRMEALLRQPKAYNTLESEAFIYAPPVRSGRPYLWPVLTFAADSDSDRLKVEAALFHENEETSDEAEAEGVSATGFRFEPPEDRHGVHSYYHAQPITSFGGRADGRLSFARVVNTSFPAFPLAARDSVGLLAAALVCLYGRTGTRTFLADPQIRAEVELMKPSFESWILNNKPAY